MMHKAICDECGRECEVPFRPSGDRPVYCSNCFEKQSGNEGNIHGPDNRYNGKSRSDGRRFTSQDAYDNSNRQIVEQLKSLNAKLDKIIGVLAPKASVPDLIDPMSLITRITEPEAEEPMIIEPKKAEPQDEKPKNKKPKAHKKKTTGDGVLK